MYEDVVVNTNDCVTMYPYILLKDEVITTSVAKIKGY